MAIKTKEELLNSIKAIIKDDTSDETLGLLEDVEDTFNDFDEKVKDTTDYKAKYEENDKAWREKYKARFYGEDKESKKDNTVVDEPEIDTEKKKTFDELFTEEEKK